MQGKIIELKSRYSKENRVQMWYELISGNIGHDLGYSCLCDAKQVAYNLKMSTGVAYKVYCPYYNELLDA